MNWTDIVNGAFELLGGFFIIPSIIQAFKTNKVESVSPLTTIFFTSWGCGICFFILIMDLC